MTKEKKKHSHEPQQPPDDGPELAEPVETQPEPQPDLQELLDSACAQRDEYLALAQRVQADFENFRKRNASVRQEAREDGARDALTPLLAVLDNLERAADAAKDETSALKEGVNLVLRQLTEVLAKQGVVEIDCLGKPFDPEEASAVLHQADENAEPGTVSEVFQKGYRMGQRVLRYAMVKVVAG